MLMELFPTRNLGVEEENKGEEWEEEGMQDRLIFL